MNYQDLLRTHQQSGAAVTIAALPVSSDAASGLGIMRTDPSGRVCGFVEKPKTEAALAPVRLDASWFAAQGIESRGRDCLANMGIYVFNRDVLVDILMSTDYEDFGRQVFPQFIEKNHVQVHLFDGYWEDIGTIKAFYDANLSLVQENPSFELISPGSLVYSRARYLPPSRVNGAAIKSSLLADGCVIGAGAVIENSIIGLRSMIGPNVTIRNSVLMGADFYEGQIELGANRASGIPPVGIGEGSVIEGAIIDKNCHVGRNVRIVNDQGVENWGSDDEMCMIRDGVAITVKDAELVDGYRLNPA
jgi:glucose-1-phosphate adenylyltransferase